MSHSWHRHIHSITTPQLYPSFPLLLQLPPSSPPSTHYHNIHTISSPSFPPVPLHTHTITTPKPHPYLISPVIIHFPSTTISSSVRGRMNGGLYQHGRCYHPHNTSPQHHPSFLHLREKKKNITFPGYLLHHLIGVEIRRETQVGRGSPATRPTDLMGGAAAG